jgi:hypothetical protein
MTDLVAARAAAMDKALGPAYRGAAALIAAKVADARAHAINALTEKAKDAPDGRKTIALVRRSRSTTAAQSRLAEMAIALVKLVADWRERCYREGFHWWATRPPADPRFAEYLRPDPKPTDRNLSWSRGFALHGTPLVTEVKTAMDAASRTLTSTLARAATRTLRGRDSTDLIRAWEMRTTAAIVAVAESLLTDSQMLCDRKAGRDVCRPELLEDDPTLPR